MNIQLWKPKNKEKATSSCFKFVTPFSFRKRCKINRWFGMTSLMNGTSKEVFYTVGREP